MSKCVYVHINLCDSEIRHALDTQTHTRVIQREVMYFSCCQSTVVDFESACMVCERADVLLFANGKG